METGYITARVYTSDAELPVEGAIFSVLSHADNKKLLAVRITDENGKTSQIPFEAPSAQLSENPGNPEPYLTVDIRVDHPDFNTEFVEGVQIFSGQVSVQNVALIPTAEHISYDKKANTFTIEPNTDL